MSVAPPNDIPEGAALGRRIVYEQFSELRDEVQDRIGRATAAARALPTVAGVDLAGIGIYGVVFQPPQTNPLWYLLVITGSALVAGFFASAELVSVVFSTVQLGFLEQRLGVPREAGYWAEDVHQHHLRSEPWPVSSANRVLFGVRLRNVWIRALMFMNLWTAVLVSVVGGAIAVVLWNADLLIAALASAVLVWLALTGTTRVMLASFPASVVDALQHPDGVDWIR